MKWELFIIVQCSLLIKSHYENSLMIISKNNQDCLRSILLCLARLAVMSEELRVRVQNVGLRAELAPVNIMTLLGTFLLRYCLAGLVRDGLAVKLRRII